MRYVGLGRNNLRSHFVFRPRHAPKWLRARFLPVIFLANEEELTGKTFTTSLNTTNPNTYMKFIFLRTSLLTMVIKRFENFVVNLYLAIDQHPVCPYRAPAWTLTPEMVPFGPKTVTINMQIDCRYRYARLLWSHQLTSDLKGLIDWLILLEAQQAKNAYLQGIPDTNIEGD